jgi:filamentous hemagglutinin
VNAHGSASSTTMSGISAGNITITNAAGQQALTGETVAQTLAGLNRNTTSGPNTLAQFNLSSIQQSMQATSIIGSEASQFVAYELSRADSLRAAAQASGELSQAGIADNNEAGRIENQWGFGGTDRNIVNAVVGALTGNATGSFGQIVQGSIGNFVGSQLSTQIGKLAGNGIAPDGSPLNVVLHTAAGCAGAVIGGENCGSSALGAGVAAAATNLFPTPSPGETNAQKQAVANLIETIAGVTGLGTGTGNLANTITAATSATENNFLGASQQKNMDRELAACKSVVCLFKVSVKYNIISRNQDRLLVQGILEGAGGSAWGTVSGLANLLANLPQTITEVQQIIADPSIQRQLIQNGQGALVASFQQDIQDYKNAMTDGGDHNSEQYGKDLGSLLFQVAALGTGVAGASKLAVAGITAIKGLVASGEAAGAVADLGDSVPALFRGTSEGFPGSPNLQRIGVTPVTTNPAVAAVFGTASSQFGNGIVQIALPGDIDVIDIIPGNVLAGVEQEVGVSLPPTQFTNQVSVVITAAQAGLAPISWTP